MKSPKGISNILLIILGLFLAGTLFGVLKNSSIYGNGRSSSNTPRITTASRTMPITVVPPVAYPDLLPSSTGTQTTTCGLNISSPSFTNPLPSVISFAGFVRGCHWDVVNGYAGTVEILDNDKTPLSQVLPLTVTNASTQSFSIVATLLQPSRYKKGYIIFKNNVTAGAVAREISVPVYFK